MYQKDGKQCSQQEQTKSWRDTSSNILRRLTMLKKAVGRLVRRTYPARSHYPALFFQIETAIERFRAWIQTYRFFSGLSAFQVVYGERLHTLRHLIGQLQEHCRPSVKSKNRQRSRPWQAYRKLCWALEKMLSHPGGAVQPSGSRIGSMECALEKALRTAVDRFQEVPPFQAQSPAVSRRGTRTIIFPWAQPEGYLDLVTDGKRFRREVLEPLEPSSHAMGHGACCKAKKCYKLLGFRSQPRKPGLVGGQQAEFPIRMIQCLACGAKFSLLPSFLAREKHFALDLIGHVVTKMMLFGQSLQASLADLAMLTPGGHSKQTLLDWITWFGTLHPATILTRAGIQGTGYFQEDEGFETESGLRTYTVALVEPETLLVWHLDYVDAVDEETLYESFEGFVQQISFHVLGVTKDKW